VKDRRGRGPKKRRDPEAMRRDLRKKETARLCARSLGEILPRSGHELSDQKQEGGFTNGRGKQR